MKELTISILIDQYVSDIMDELQSNVIYSKPTGIGFTHLELLSKRCVIEVEPNKPVIQGKCREFNGRNRRNLKIRGVYEGITVQDIVNYIKSPVKYKKIITTPESYSKVVSAFRELGLLKEFYKKYFMLFDECEKTVQDIGYRENITLPMNDFFTFENKAFVSATPIIPSDPRFKTQGFKLVKIEFKPKRKQPIEVIATNNTFLSLQKHLNESNKEQYFIFLNSTKAIVGAMEFLGIKDESLVFCSDESKGKLLLNGYKNATSSLDSKLGFKKYNFFTCRFNSAVDILGIKDPHVIILSDCFYAEHTRVDPYSEVLQIVGRFRRPKRGGIKRKLVHITNFNSDLVANTEEEIMADISKMFEIYKYTLSIYKATTTFIAKEVIRELLENTRFSTYIGRDGKTNYYMIDNTLFENKVNGYYICMENLLEAYKATKAFNIKVTPESYAVNDAIKKSIANALNKLETTIDLLIPIIKEIKNTGFDTPENQLLLIAMEKDHPTAFKKLKAIGLERVAELKDGIAVNQEFEKLESNSKIKHFGILGHLKIVISIGDSYSSEEIVDILKAGYEKYNLPTNKISVNNFKDYYDLSPRTYIGYRDGKSIYGYKVLDTKFKN